MAQGVVAGRLHVPQRSGPTQTLSSLPVLGGRRCHWPQRYPWQQGCCLLRSIPTRPAATDTTGGCRSDSGVVARAWGPGEGPAVVACDLITSQLLRGAAWAATAQCSPAGLPGRNHKWEGMGGGELMNTSLASFPGQYFRQTLCTCCLSFSVQGMCPGTTWRMPLGRSFCHVVAACPQCRQNARVPGPRRKD